MHRIGSLLGIAAVLAAASCGASRPLGEGGSILTGTWSKLPQAPLPARHEAHVFALDDEILVAGGTTAPPCPPNASCVPPQIPPLRDGAVFDPASGNWRAIAQPPVPMGFATGAVVGRRLYLWLPGFEEAAGVRAAFLAYDAATNQWSELPLPPGSKRGALRLVAAGSRIVAYRSTQEEGVEPDLVFDAGAWRELARDPLVPSFDRTMAWTGRELILLGPENVPQPGSQRPALYRAAALDLSAGTWRRLPDSGVVGHDPSWFYAGNSIVNATHGSADGGEVNNWGRSYPFGGILDPATGLWRELPPAPKPGSYSGPATANDRFVTTRGLVFDSSERTWTSLSMPAGVVGGHGSAWGRSAFFVWGGYNDYGDLARLSADGWAWTPAAGRIIP